METAVQNTTENRTPTRTPVTLTQEIGRAIVKAILSGERWYDKASRTATICLPNDDGTEREIYFSTDTYDSWIRRGTIVPETERSLRELTDEAREKYKQIKEKKADEQRIALSERALTELLSLPITHTSVMRELKRDKTGKMKEVKRTTIKDISSPLVQAKVKGLTFALERLKPEKYGKKDEVKHAHVIFSLAELRKHRDENKTNQTQQ